jgi:ketosteroid isomerase-like protein
MTTDREPFERFMERRADIAVAYVNGDAGPLREIAAARLPATFFGPMGDCQKGADEVWAAYEAGASAFSPGSDTEVQVLDVHADDEVGYWVGIQRAKVRMGDAPEPTSMDLRVTEIFRREDDQWKLVHRHADPLRP